MPDLSQAFAASLDGFDLAELDAMDNVVYGVDADNAIVHQCCHCRRIRHPEAPGRWDWVPALVATPSPRTSHTLCAACLDFYYPEDDALQAPYPVGAGS